MLKVQTLWLPTVASECSPFYSVCHSPTAPLRASQRNKPTAMDLAIGGGGGCPCPTAWASNLTAISLYLPANTCPNRLSTTGAIGHRAVLDQPQPLTHYQEPVLGARWAWFLSPIQSNTWDARRSTDWPRFPGKVMRHQVAACGIRDFMELVEVLSGWVVGLASYLEWWTIVHHPCLFKYGGAGATGKEQWQERCYYMEEKQPA